MSKKLSKNIFHLKLQIAPENYKERHKVKGIQANIVFKLLTTASYRG